MAGKWCPLDLAAMCLEDFFFRPTTALRTWVELARRATRKCMGAVRQSYFLYRFSKEHIDLVHASFPKAPLIDRAYQFHKSLGVPFTLTFRAEDLHGAEWRPKLLQRKDVIRESAGIITISEFNRRTIKELFPFLGRIVVAHSSIDASFFKRTSPSEKRRAVFVGRFVEKKGIEHLLRACARLQAQDPNFDCVLAGDGPLTDRLVSLAEQLHLKNVSFTGFASREQVRSILSSAAVFVLPAVVPPDGNRDMLANVIKEAMAMEIPVVTSDISGIEELVENGRSGLLVPEGNPDALADAIKLLLDDPALRRRMGAAGRKRVLEAFDSKRELGKVERAFLRAATGGPGSLTGADGHHPKV